jgi:hypothetical protein
MSHGGRQEQIVQMRVDYPVRLRPRIDTSLLRSRRRAGGAFLANAPAPGHAQTVQLAKVDVTKTATGHRASK